MVYHENIMEKKLYRSLLSFFGRRPNPFLAVVFANREIWLRPNSYIISAQFITLDKSHALKESVYVEAGFARLVRQRGKRNLDV